MAKTFIWTIGSFRLKAVKQLRIIQNYKIHFCLYIEKDKPITNKLKQQKNFY